MCGRYVIASGPQELSERFGAHLVLPGFGPSFNVAPTRVMPVVVEDQEGERQFQAMRWGIQPRWRKEGAATPPPLINARAETVAEKPTFGKLLRGRRCLVPATGFYEWERSVTGKVPHFFSVPDLPILAYAGLYDEPADGDAASGAFTILTTRANDLVAPFHDRMPVILRPEAEEVWLDPDLHEPAALEALYDPFPQAEMAEWSVGTQVNDARIDSPSLIERPV